VTAELTVEKALRVTARGYYSAVERLRKAVDAGNPDDVYISLTDTLQWLTMLAERTSIKSDNDVIALIYARERAHHQSASIVYHDEQGRWFWRPAVSLPLPDDTKHQGTKHLPIYERRLQEKPLLEAFERIDKLLAH
jgi:hypothetical protein